VFVKKILFPKFLQDQSAIQFNVRRSYLLHRDIEIILVFFFVAV